MKVTILYVNFVYCIFIEIFPQICKFYDDVYVSCIKSWCLEIGVIWVLPLLFTALLYTTVLMVCLRLYILYWIRMKWLGTLFLFQGLGKMLSIFQFSIMLAIDLPYIDLLYWYIFHLHQMLLGLSLWWCFGFCKIPFFWSYRVLMCFLNLNLHSFV